MANSSTIRNRLTHTNWKLAFKPFLCITSTRRLMISYFGCPFFLSQLLLFFSFFFFFFFFLFSFFSFLSFFSFFSFLFFLYFLFFPILVAPFFSVSCYFSFLFFISLFFSVSCYFSFLYFLFLFFIATFLFFLFLLFGYLLWFSPSSEHLIVNFIILIFPILRRFVFTFYLLILNSQLHSALYRGWLGQHRFCYNTNTWPSFLNSWMSFWFFFKTWKTWPIVWKTRPYVLKHILVRVFCKIQFLKIWTVKSTAYSLESNMINLFNLLFVYNIWNYSLKY